MSRYSNTVEWPWCRSTVIMQHKACSSVLHILYFLNVSISMRVPGTACILQLWSDESDVCPLLHLGVQAYTVVYCQRLSESQQSWCTASPATLYIAVWCYVHVGWICDQNILFSCGNRPALSSVTGQLRERCTERWLWPGSCLGGREQWWWTNNCLGFSWTNGGVSWWPCQCCIYIATPIWRWGYRISRL